MGALKRLILSTVTLTHQILICGLHTRETDRSEISDVGPLVVSIRFVFKPAVTITRLVGDTLAVGCVDAPAHAVPLGCKSVRLTT